jgi:hypothetical protein
MSEVKPEDYAHLNVGGASTSSEVLKPEDYAHLNVGGAVKGDPMGAALEAGTRSGLQTGGFMGGAALGLKVGTAAMPFLGPLAPAGPIVGGLAGGIGGYMAGEKASEGLGLRSPEQMDASVRPGAYFGESLGGGLAVAGAPYALAATGVKFGGSMVGRYLNDIINTAKTTPIAFAAKELPAVALSATGAGVAEIVAPGNTAARIGAEILAPSGHKLSLAAVQFTWGIARKAITSFSPAAQQTAAAKIITELMTKTGEDPVATMRVIREMQKLPGAENLTSAQLAGSPALGALQKRMGELNRTFGAEAAERADAALDVMRWQIATLGKTGDPAALAAAAQIRGVYYRTLLTGAKDAAEAQTLAAARRIAKDTPDSRERLSIQAREALDKVIADTRVVEKDLWSKVDNTIPVSVTNLESTFDEIAGDLLPELRNQKMPPIVSKFLNRVNSPKEAPFAYDPDTFSVRQMDVGDAVGTNAKEMKQLRSELLELSRKSVIAGEDSQARIYNQMAEAVLDDMDAAFKLTRNGAYDEARAFTKELNDVFTRSFAGKVVAQGRYGDRVAPEILLRKALATGKEAGAMQMLDLEEATRFLVNKGLGDDGAVKQMLDAQERLFRLAASDAVDPLTGRASPDRISKFIRDNGALMKRFPEVKDDLIMAVKSEDRLKTITNRAKNVESLLVKQGDFATLFGANSSDPTTRAAVARKITDRVLASPDQDAELLKLINVAKGGGAGAGGRIAIKPEEAIDGLRASLFDSIINKSRNPRDGVLNIEQVRTHLFVPTSVGKKPLIAVMLEQGVMKQEEISGIRRIFDLLSNIERAHKPGTALAVKTGFSDVVMTLMARFAGSKAASGFQQVTGGGNSASLIVHGAAAKAAESIVTKIPMQSVNKIIVEALNDPAKMGILLTKVDSPAAAAKQARHIHAWLVQSGLTGASDSIPREYEQPPKPPTMFTSPR